MPRLINQAQALNGLNPLAYMGVQPSTPTQFVTNSQRDPNANDWQNFYIGAEWLNNGVIPQRVWKLVSLQNNQATWIMFAGGGGGVITSLRADDGNIANPLLGVVNVLGPAGLAGVVYTTAAIPNTLTIHLGGQIADIYPCNTGNAVPVAGVLNVLGDGVHVTTTGAGNTITITEIGGGTVQTLTGNTGGAVSPTAGNINVVGDAVGITIAGNPGTHTLTASLVGGGVAAQSFHPDVGANVVPTAAGVVNLHSAAGTIAISNGGANTVNFEVVAVPPAQFIGFRVSQPIQVNNVTGDGTMYQIIFPTVTYDTTGGYNNATGVFTVPTTGYWHFSCFVAPINPAMGGFPGAQNGFAAYMICSDGQILFGPAGNPNAYQVLTGSAGAPGGAITGYIAEAWSGDLLLAAGTTVTVQFFVAGGARTAGSGGNPYWTAFLIGS